MNIPILDLNDQYAENPTLQDNFVKNLGISFENIGFIAIVNHGIDTELIERLYSSVIQFFSLPLNLKHKYEIAGIAGQRGYTSFGKEHAKGSSFPDLKEFFQYGQVQNDLNKPLSNVNVDEIPDFNDSMNHAFMAFERTGLTLLSSIALYLGLNRDYFNEKVKGGNSILRAIHYPPITNEPSSALRAEQHEDINLITLLVGASADGLEILGKNGSWLPVKAEPGHIIVNVGDMLQRLTNNRFQSTTHRVVNPPRSLWHTSRFSIPFFLHPHGSTSLSCLECCISEEHPKIYKDITADEYLDERLREIGLKS